MKYIYRFRDVKKCLGEIQEKYFYCSSTEKLNDPMEGVRDIFFTKGHPLWKQLINLYFIYLHYTIKNDSSFEDVDNYWSNNALIDEYIKNVLHANDFSEPLSQYSQSILFEKESSYNISMDELLHKFTELGYVMIIAMLKVDKNFNEKSPLQSLILYFNINIFNTPFRDIELSLPPPFDIRSKVEESLKRLLCIFNNQTKLSELNILLAYKMTRDNFSFMQYHYILPKLVIEFLDKLKNIINNNLGILCFSEDYSEPLMWSHYADNHKGVSLIFDLKNIEKDLNKALENDLVCSKVIYDNNLHSLDWFDASQISKNKKVYAKDYFTRKITNWSYEKEYRIITSKQGKIEYNYSALSGIIFGINTHTEDMLNFILEISKLKNTITEKFNFYKAYYCKDYSKIEIKKIELGEILKLITLPCNY